MNELNKKKLLGASKRIVRARQVERRVSDKEDSVVVMNYSSSRSESGLVRDRGRVGSLRILRILANKTVIINKVMKFRQIGEQFMAQRFS